MASDGGNVKGFLVGLMTGGIIGAAFALLYAPKSGKELRSDLKERTDDMVHDAEEYLQKARTKAVDAINEGKKRADQIIADARKKGEELLHDAENVLSSAKEKAGGLMGEGEKVKGAVKAGMKAYKEERERKKE